MAWSSWRFPRTSIRIRPASCVCSGRRKIRPRSLSRAVPLVFGWRAARGGDLIGLYLARVELAGGCQHLVERVVPVGRSRAAHETNRVDPRNDESLEVRAREAAGFQFRDALGHRGVE